MTRIPSFHRPTQVQNLDGEVHPRELRSETTSSFKQIGQRVWQGLTSRSEWLTQWKLSGVGAAGELASRVLLRRLGLVTSGGLLMFGGRLGDELLSAQFTKQYRAEDGNKAMWYEMADGFSIWGASLLGMKLMQKMSLKLGLVQWFVAQGIFTGVGMIIGEHITHGLGSQRRPTELTLAALSLLFVDSYLMLFRGRALNKAGLSLDPHIAPLEERILRTNRVFAGAAYEVPGITDQPYQSPPTSPLSPAQEMVKTVLYLQNALDHGEPKYTLLHALGCFHQAQQASGRSADTSVFTDIIQTPGLEADLYQIAFEALGNIQQQQILQGEAVDLHFWEQQLERFPLEAPLSGFALVCEALIRSGQSAPIHLLEQKLTHHFERVPRAAAEALGPIYQAQQEQGQQPDLSKLEVTLRQRDIDWQLYEKGVAALLPFYQQQIKDGHDLDLTFLTQQMRIKLDEYGRPPNKHAAEALASLYEIAIAQGRDVDITEWERLCPLRVFDEDLKDSGYRSPMVHLIGAVYRARLRQGQPQDLSVLTNLYQDSNWFLKNDVDKELTLIYLDKIERGEDPDISLLENRMQASPSEIVQRKLAPLLAQIYKAREGEIDLSVLESMLIDAEISHPEVAAICLKPLYQRQTEQGQPPDLTWLTNEVTKVTEDLADKVGDLYKDAPGSPFLIPYYRLLITFGHPIDLAPFHQCLESPLPRARRYGAALLSEIYKLYIEAGHDVDLDRLKKTLQDEDTSVQRQACIGLGSVYAAQTRKGIPVDASPIRELALEPILLRKHLEALYHIDLARVKQRQPIDLGFYEPFLDDWNRVDDTTTYLKNLLEAYLENGWPIDLSPLAKRLRYNSILVRSSCALRLAEVFEKMAKKTVIDSETNRRFQLLQQIYRPSTSDSTYWALLNQAFTVDLQVLEKIKAELTELQQNFEQTNAERDEERQLDSDDFLGQVLPLATALEMILPGSIKQLTGLLKATGNPQALVRFLEAKQDFLTSEAAVAFGDYVARRKVALAGNTRKKVKINAADYSKAIDMANACLAVMDGEHLRRFLAERPANEEPKALLHALTQSFRENFGQSFGIEGVAPHHLDSFYGPFLPRLRPAFQHIQEKHPDKLKRFQATLKAGLQGRFWDLIEDTKQDDTVGQQIAQHNQGVRQALAEVGVHVKRWLGKQTADRFNPDSVLYYDKGDSTYDPVTDVDGVVDYLGRAFNLELNQHTLNPLITFLDRQGMALASHVSKRTVQVKATAKGKEDYYKTFAQADFLTGLENEISRLLALREINQDPKKLETITHLKEHVQILKARLQSQDYQKVLTKKKWSFKARPMYREPGHDLFIGDFTSCCLAMNSREFPEAMVDRLIDQGMNVLELVDEATDLPMACAWLYVDEKGNLVIQNLEINANYEVDPDLKAFVGHTLIAQTKQFGKHIEAKETLIGQVEHGKFFGPGRLVNKHYADDEVEFGNEKIGGYLEGEKYYLHSAGKPKAYRV